jgi:hypothetical protein
MNLDPNDRVLKRGSKHLGTVSRVSPYGWVHVDWDLGPAPRERPRICTARELQPVPAD